MQGKTDDTYIRDACKEMGFVEGAPLPSPSAVTKAGSAISVKVRTSAF